jgi:hypothetical protein
MAHFKAVEIHQEFGEMKTKPSKHRHSSECDSPNELASSPPSFDISSPQVFIESFPSLQSLTLTYPSHQTRANRTIEVTTTLCRTETTWTTSSLSGSEIAQVCDDWSQEGVLRLSQVRWAEILPLTQIRIIWTKQQKKNKAKMTRAPSDGTCLLKHYW